MSSFYLPFLCIHLIFLVKSQAQLDSIAEEVSALYVFGDSIVDCGNKYSAHSLLNATYFPYGVDFPFPPSGRYTNGRTIADFLGKKKPKMVFRTSECIVCLNAECDHDLMMSRFVPKSDYLHSVLPR